MGMLVRALVFSAVAVVGCVLAFAFGGVAVGIAWVMIAVLSSKFLFLGEMLRIGFSGGDERQAEAEAREFLARHGHWPDEPAPATAGATGD